MDREGFLGGRIDRQGDERVLHSIWEENRGDERFYMVWWENR